MTGCFIKRIETESHYSFVSEYQIIVENNQSNFDSILTGLTFICAFELKLFKRFLKYNFFFTIKRSHFLNIYLLVFKFERCKLELSALFQVFE